MKSTLKNIFFVTIPTFLVLFLIIEIVLRVGFDHIEDYDSPMLSWSDQAPFSAYTAKPGVYGDKTVNSHGFISTPELEMEKPKSTVRIVFLGGSSTAGTGVNLGDTETWPWKTIEKLKASTEVKIDFINGALGGYSTFESYGRLWSRLRFYDPDILVVYHGWNEMYYFNEIADNPISWRKTYTSESSFRIFLKKILSWSQAFARIKLAWDHHNLEGKNGERSAAKILKTDFNLKGLEIYEDNLNLIKSFAKVQGCELFVCKQPTLITEKMKEEDLDRCYFEYHGFDHNSHVRAFNGIYAVIEANIPKTNIIDLTELSGRSDCFYDHVHPTKKGTTEIATLVANSLASNYFK